MARLCHCYHRRVMEGGDAPDSGQPESNQVKSNQIDSREFRRVLGCYPTGVTVVTASCPDGPEGLTIGSFTSVSLDPPLVSFCAGRDSDSWQRMRRVGSFCVNVLSDRQAELSSAFAGASADRFAGVATRSESTGAPVIEGCLAWIDCKLNAMHPAGDHDIVIGEVVALGTSDGAGPDSAGPLVFLRGAYGRVEGLGL
ncbi:MAG: flavin reductase family protein [Acidimicrobiaceae bacterium]|nr:flavin reductase family protein [Acidimicrobiaceae bacterium]MCY4280178.1 flavin reductase family protein [Acidimicrobiaceae bacterium]MCY4293449.1 flavin reductase family protein [Acidimicrobiaceae bacterium]